MKVKTSSLSLIAALSTLSTAYAQAPQTDGDVERETIVVTASRTRLPADQVGSAVTVIAASQIRADQIQFVRDVLQDVPGVQITNDRPGASSTVSIRGSDNDQVLFLIDGIELGDPSVISTQFQSEHLTSLDVDRIEVLRGNQSSLYGSDAIGGVVNIITQRATEDGVHVNAEAEVGSENARSAGLTLLGRNAGVDYRLTATGYAVDGPSAADPLTGPAVEDDGYSRTSLSGRVGASIADGVEAQLVGFYSDSSTDMDNTDSDSSDKVEKDEYGLAAQLTHETSTGAWRNELTLSRYNSERRYFGMYYRPQGDGYDGTKDAAQYVTRLRASERIDIAAGLSWEKEESEQVTNYSGSLNADITTKSAFAELALRPVENLTVTAAARVDDNSRFGTFDTYRVTAAYLMPEALAGADVKVRASYGTGAKAPGLYQLFDPTYGNPDLEVETSEGYDAGVDLIWDRARVELTVFDNDVTNEIGFDGSRPPFGGYAQFGRTKSRGVEMGARVELASWVAITQTLTVLDSQDGDTGFWKGRPRYAGTTGVAFQVTPAWDLSARLRYRTENASSYGGVTEGYGTLDILTSYDINDRLELYGRIVNVSDEEYQMSWGANAPDRGVFAGIRARF